MSMVIEERHCFYPDEFQYIDPGRWGLSFEPFHFTGPSGELLTGWHIPPKEESDVKNRTVLHFHGNAQNMTAHLFASYFLALDGFRLITFDYRGYGQSGGNPTLDGILEDGRAVIRRLLDEPFGPGEPLCLFGQSMGAFTTAYMLPDFPELDRAILEAGLISFRGLFEEAYPQADIRVPANFSTLDPLCRSSVPKFFIHGDADRVVPYSHSQRMFEAAAEPKELLLLEGVGHIDALETPRADEYRTRVVNFLADTEAA